MRTGRPSVSGLFLMALFLFALGVDAILKGQIVGHSRNKQVFVFLTDGPLAILVGWVLVAIGVGMVLRMVWILLKKK